jgi:hypothetical protein
MMQGHFISTAKPRSGTWSGSTVKAEGMLCSCLSPPSCWHSDSLARFMGVREYVLDVWPDGEETEEACRGTATVPVRLLNIPGSRANPAAQSVQPSKKE